jgi:hypothetical protein
MNLPQLVFFALGIYGSFVLARFLHGYIGWWGIVPAAIVSFGAVYLLFSGTIRTLEHFWKPPRRGRSGT